VATHVATGKAQRLRQRASVIYYLSNGYRQVPCQPLN
jgi:hypothetical protein